MKPYGARDAGDAPIKTTVGMISTLELTKAASQKEGSRYGATKGSGAPGTSRGGRHH